MAGRYCLSFLLYLPTLKYVGIFRRRDFWVSLVVMNQKATIVFPHFSRAQSCGTALFLLGLLIVFGAACGSNAALTGDNSESTAAGNTADGETAPGIDPSGPAPVDPSDANNQAVEPMALAESKREKLDKLRSGDDPQNVPIPKNLKPLRRPAPDDSEYWSTLTDVAVETRAFRNHPQIAKVERINDGKRAVIKIHRKDGKVVEHPGDRVKNISVESVVTFVRLAGLQPIATPTPPPADPARAPGKKGGQ